MTTTLICNCNRTMTLDRDALGQVLGETLAEHTTLCRRDAPAFQRAARDGDDLVVACTQESALFVELAEHTEGSAPLDVRPIRFVNIRETGGWGKDGSKATAKMAALLAAARLPEPEPVPTVTYRSEGRLLIIGALERAEAIARLLEDGLQVTVFATGGAGEQVRRHPVIAGSGLEVDGWLGAFDVRWRADNPIDLDLCTRCNACVAACPEEAIGLDYQVDLAICASHRACVKVCQAAGAIDFQREPQWREARFDLVLDLRGDPAFSRHAPPQGYVHLPSSADPDRQLRTLLELRDRVGEFEKPRFFRYRANVCAHGRNEQVGCRACIDVCSAQAIVSRLDDEVRRNQVEVNPHLCIGCGACTTVCPTGALAFAYPSASDQGRRLRTLLATYARAGGRDAAVLIHSQQAGAARIAELGRAAALDGRIHGLPSRVIPFAAWHTASLGLDIWLSAIAWGATQVWVLATDEEAPQYLAALAEQMNVGNAILQGLGYRCEAGSDHLRLLAVGAAGGGTTAAPANGPAVLVKEPQTIGPALHWLDRTLQTAPAQGPGSVATFGVQDDKRATLELALDHLIRHAPAADRQPAAAGTDGGAAARIPGMAAIALPRAGSPFGRVVVDAGRCTLCLACVGACPASALQDNLERPQLRFVEKNCVLCGLCESTCPEDAITLESRLLLTEARRQPQVVNEQPPFACIQCGKPFGTVKAIETMIVRLSGHQMFQGRALDRLRMCSDCRVIDLYTADDETRIDAP
jgi:ferredoxin